MPHVTNRAKLTGDAAVTDVRAAKTFYNTDPKTQETGTGDLSEHLNSENSDVGAFAGGETSRYDTVADTATIVSGSITTTARCAIIVIASLVTNEAAKCTDLKRGGVTKTTETTLSSVNFAFVGGYCHCQEAIEVLDAGSYTYDLINTNGAAMGAFGAYIKIVAVTFG